jgi:hypothetical protein
MDRSHVRYGLLVEADPDTTTSVRERHWLGDATSVGEPARAADEDRHSRQDLLDRTQILEPLGLDIPVDIIWRKCCFKDTLCIEDHEPFPLNNEPQDSIIAPPCDWLPIDQTAGSLRQASNQLVVGVHGRLGW